MIEQANTLRMKNSFLKEGEGGDRAPKIWVTKLPSQAKKARLKVQSGTRVSPNQR